MTNVSALAVDEPVRVDAKRVGDIVTELGERAAENVITLALEQMALALEEIAGAQKRNDRDLIRQQADRLARLAWQVGLVSMSGIAVDVAQCARRDDPVALGAVMGRLLRVGNRSLTQIWEERGWV